MAISNSKTAGSKLFKGAADTTQTGDLPQEKSLYWLNQGVYITDNNGEQKFRKLGGMGVPLNYVHQRRDTMDAETLNNVLADLQSFAVKDLKLAAGEFVDSVNEWGIVTRISRIQEDQPIRQTSLKLGK